MGATYVSFTLSGGDQSSIAAALKNRNAFISRPVNGHILICDEQSDALIWSDSYHQLGQELSVKFSCRCLVIANDHDDVFAYRLLSNGEILDEYTTHKNGFAVNAEKLPLDALGGITGGDAEILSRAYGREAMIDEIEAVLRVSHDSERYCWETNRHIDLLDKLGLPPFGSSGFHFLYYNGEFPDGLTEHDFVYTGTDIPSWERERQRQQRAK